MAYSHTTFGQAKTNLALLLSDPNNAFWTDAELGVYIIEALRTWGSLTEYWKTRGVFSASPNTAFYDLPSLVSARSYNVTEQDLIDEICYHLIEAEPSGGTWEGTDQFSITDLTQALQRRRDQFLYETGCVVKRFTQVSLSPPIGRQVLPDTTMQVRRVAWIDANSVYTTLWKEDEWTLQGYYGNWTDPSLANNPQFYSVSVTPPLSLQLAPPPQGSGTVEVLCLQSGTPLDPDTSALIGVPDDFCWAVKFGALADLLGKDGQARDPQRASYCKKRWEEGVAAAKVYTSVMRAYINGVPVQTDSLHDIDTYRTTWQTKRSKPDLFGMAGMNLMALANVPDAAYSVMVDVVSNATVPASADDQIQVGREELDAILGYAEHLAAFKMGGQEFEITVPLYNRFLDLAAAQNGKFKALARAPEALSNRAQIERDRRPLEVVPQ